MNSLSQYLELYRLNAEAIDSGSAPVINALRAEAFEQLSHLSLPQRGDENYERTSVEDMFAADYGVNINRMDIKADVAASFRCDVPNMSTLLGVVVNDAFHPTRGLLNNLPEGVLFCSLRQAAVEYPELVKTHYGTLAPLTDAATALNTMLVQDGVMIYVPDGVTVEKPLQLVNIFSAPTSLMAARRVLVVMGQGASAQLLVCDHTQDAEQQYLSSQVIEVVMGRDSHLEVCDIEESSANTVRHSQLYVRQEQGSKFVNGGVTLTCGSTRNEYNVDIHGEHAESLLSGMVIATGRQHVDNNVLLRHLSGGSHSNQLFKYVLDDEATGAFGGKIFVAPGARFTDAYQTNRNMLASTAARMHAKPQLEIYNDDVKCSHGATTGQLDSEALFYMRTRGIPEAEARNMLMQAFMADVIDTVHIEGLRDRLRHLVERRFNGFDEVCGNCQSTCKK